MTCKILLVDDEPPTLFAMHCYLTAKGFDVRCARELEEARELLSNDLFDVVITDLRLSPIREAEGLLVIEYVRSTGMDARLIVLTAYASSEVEAAARRLGVDLFLRKPASLPELEGQMRELMAPAPGAEPAGEE